jgi:hypothetical protein
MSGWIGIVLAGFVAGGAFATTTGGGYEHGGGGMYPGGTPNGPKACPPGLEKKDNGCMPPGQLRRHDTHAMGNNGIYPGHTGTYPGHTGGGMHGGGMMPNGPKACPPGLEKKDNGCMPPGQLRRHDTHEMGNNGKHGRSGRDHHASRRDDNRGGSGDRSGRK